MSVACFPPAKPAKMEPHEQDKHKRQMALLHSMVSSVSHSTAVDAWIGGSVAVHERQYSKEKWNHGDVDLLVDAPSQKLFERFAQKACSHVGGRLESIIESSSYSNYGPLPIKSWAKCTTDKLFAPITFMQLTVSPAQWAQTVFLPGAFLYKPTSFGLEWISPPGITNAMLQKRLLPNTSRSHQEYRRKYGLRGFTWAQEDN